MNPYDILDKDNLQKVANAGITIENRKYSEDELKMVLFGIEQRFYTTPVGDEKRIANSVIPMK